MNKRVTKCQFTLSSQKLIVDIKDKVTEIFDLIPEVYKEDIEVYCKHYFPKSSQWKNLNSIKVHGINQPISQIEAELSMKAFEKGFKSTRLDLRGKYSYCPSTTLHYFTITPDLKVYKCNAAIGVRPPIGEITYNGKIEYILEKLSNWLLINPFEDEKCLNCKLLPVCMGDAP